MPDLSVFKKEGIQMLMEYKDYKSPMSIRCSKGHTTRITMNSVDTRVSRGTPICKECVKEAKKLGLKDKIGNLLKAKNYELLSKEVQYGKKVLYRCDKGHENSMEISNLMNGKSCPDCYGNKKTTTENIKEKVESKGLVVIGEPEGSKTEFNCECTKGHVFETSYDRIVSGGSGCPECVGNPSKQEVEVLEFITSIYEGEIISHDRKILAGKELDILLPELKLAIEYCGLYWHSEGQGKDIKYHLGKLEACEAVGYRLITLFEDEWVNQNDKCKSRLASRINSSGMRRIFARKCTIKGISGKEAKMFCDTNHIQGYGSGSSIKLGAFLGEELVAVMTFSKPSLAKGRKKYKAEGIEYELHRFCPKLNTVVVGGASKLMKYFERNHECDRIFTFADKRWGTANLYYNLGFTKVADSAPCYYYFKDGSTTRQHRFVFRKNVLKDKLEIFDPNLTEVQNCYNAGYHRIFDCGNFKLCKEYKNA